MDGPINHLAGSTGPDHLICGDAIQMPPRDGSGRFVAPAPSAGPPPDLPEPSFVGPPEAERMLRDAVRSGYVRSCAGETVTLAIRVTPGGGKSTTTRGELLAIDAELDQPLAVTTHSPTLALSDEAERAARLQGAPDQGDRMLVLRGRSALDPAQAGRRMCARHELAERANRVGLSVQTTLCRRVARTPEGEVVALCPVFDSCAYQRQLGQVTPTSHAFVTHAALTLPEHGELLPDVRVIDESDVLRYAREAVIPLDVLVARRRPVARTRDAPKDVSVDHVERAARRLLALLSDGRDALELGLDARTLCALATFELSCVPRSPRIWPSERDTVIASKLNRMRVDLGHAWRLARLWRILAEDVRSGRARCDRVVLERSGGAGGGGVRIFWAAEAPRAPYTLLLDANIDPVLLRLREPGADLVDVQLRPNAHVVQISDRSLSKMALLGREAQDADRRRGLRDRIVAVIRRAVVEDAGGGVLVGAQKGVVEQMFLDADARVFDGMGSDDRIRHMLDSPLHGARWLWFGDRSLGLNSYQAFTTVVVVGREQPPVEAIERLGRSLAGHTPEPLVLLPEDAPAMPTVADWIRTKSGAATPVSVQRHPDPRLDAILRQRREHASLQLIHRLRLVRASSPKRVILLSNLPLPDLPVDEVVTLEALVPGRLRAALHEAILSRGACRLSDAGLAADAPGTFASADAVGQYRARLRKLRHAVTYGPSSGVAPFPLIGARIRVKGQPRGVDCVIRARTPAEAERLAAAAYGELLTFEHHPAAVGRLLSEMEAER